MDPALEIAHGQGPTPTPVAGMPWPLAVSDGEFRRVSPRAGSSTGVSAK